MKYVMMLQLYNITWNIKKNIKKTNKKTNVN